MGMLGCDPEGEVQTDEHSGSDGYRVSFDPAGFRNGHERSIDGMAAILSVLEREEDIDVPKVYELIDTDGLECLIDHHYDVSGMTGELEIERATDECQVRVCCSPESVNITIHHDGTGA